MAIRKRGEKERDLHVVLDSIYDATLDPTGWGRVLESMACLLDARSGILRIMDPEHGRVNVDYHHSLDPGLLRQYCEHFVHIDPVVEYLNRQPAGVMSACSGYAINGVDMASTQPAFFADYAVPQGVYHVIGGFIAKHDSQVFKMGIQRPKNGEPFTAGELRRMQLLVPHIQRAYRISRRIMTLEGRIEAQQEAFDRLECGIVLIDCFGRICHFNQAADEMFGRTNKLRVVGGRLAAAEYHVNNALQSALCAAAEGAGKQDFLAVPREKGQPLSLMITPLSRPSGRRVGVDANAAVAVFIGDAPGRSTISPEAVASLYGLTAAESRVALALADGLEVSAIADRGRISEHTVRAQIKAAMRKTGVRRQVDLVRLLAPLLHWRPATEANE